MLSKGAHRMPIVCGHEFSGRIVAMDQAIDGWDTDELVSVAPLIPCGRCAQCQIGHPSRCLDYDYFGSRRDGAYAEYVAVPRTNLLKTPAGIDPRAAAMADPASIALHAIWKAPIQVGQVGGVVGCGPIGLFAIQWLRLMGIDRVVAVDVSEQKLEQAREAGATHCFLSHGPKPTTPPCDLVIEAAGRPATINLAVRLAGPGGHVVSIGIPTSDVTIEQASFNHLLRQEVSLHGSWNSFAAPFPGRQWSSTLEKLGSGQLRWEFMITHQLELDALPAMFKSFSEGNEFISKVMFLP
jgi:L-iditol 2-dehydrogenase